MDSQDLWEREKLLVQEIGLLLKEGLLEDLALRAQELALVSEEVAKMKTASSSRRNRVQVAMQNVQERELTKRHILADMRPEMRSYRERLIVSAKLGHFDGENEIVSEYLEEVQKLAPIHHKKISKHEFYHRGNHRWSDESD
jgi:hypothetical protein